MSNNTARPQRALTTRSKPSIIPQPRKIVARSKIDTGLNRGKPPEKEPCLQSTFPSAPTITEESNPESEPAPATTSAPSSTKVEAAASTSSVGVEGVVGERKDASGEKKQMCDIGIQAVPEPVPCSPTVVPGSSVRRANRG